MTEMAPITGQGQLRRREAGWEGRRRRNRDPRNTNRIRGGAARASRPNTAKPVAIKRPSGRCGGCAGKASALIPVTIPKPSGGERHLGVPTALDRVIQQALSQVLVPVFDPGFSERSFGFRPGRSAHDAITRAQRDIAEGHEWAVDLDLDRFFDRVQHDALMARVARRVTDKKVLKLIRRYLEAGVMADGMKQPSEEGTPQGSPLSPLLSNVYLDDLDQMLEKRGHRFVRYADDITIYVASKRAAERVMGAPASSSSHA